MAARSRRRPRRLGRLRAPAAPPWARAITSTIASPSPAPPRPRAGSARVKRSNAASRNSGGKPGPSSRTCSSTLPLTRSAASSHVPAAVAKRVVDEVAERLLRAAPGRRARRGRSAALGRVAEARAGSVAGVERLRPDRQPALLDAREHEQVLGQPRRAGRSPRRPSAARPELLAAAALAQRELELGLQDRQRRAQLVAGVGDERALALERLLEPREHLVERRPEAADLVVGRADRQARARLVGPDRGGAAAHPLDRAQRGGGRPVAGQRREQQRDRPADRAAGRRGCAARRRGRRSRCRRPPVRRPAWSRAAGTGRRCRGCRPCRRSPCHAAPVPARRA